MQNLLHLLRRLKGGSDATRDGAAAARSELSRYQDISGRIPGPLRSTIDEAWAAAHLLSKADGGMAGAGSACSQHVAPQPQIAPHFHASHATRRGTPRVNVGVNERGVSLPSREGSGMSVGMDRDTVLHASGQNPVSGPEGRCRSADTSSRTGMHPGHAAAYVSLLCHLSIPWACARVIQSMWRFGPSWIHPRCMAFAVVSAARSHVTIRLGIHNS